MPRALGALVLLASLLLGAMSHGLHHLVDRDCDTGGGPEHRACLQCSSLHAASEAAVGEVVVAATPEAFGLVHATQDVARTVYAPAPRSARAPPLA